MYTARRVLVTQTGPPVCISQVCRRAFYVDRHPLWAEDLFFDLLAAGP